MRPVKNAAFISVFLVNIAVILTFVSGRVLPSSARGNGGTVTTNGDVNGDGSLDISDAVFTLQFLFGGGAAPVACGESPDLSGRVAVLEDAVSSLQTRIECAKSVPRRIEGRFADNGDGTVTDTCSGLMWQKRTADVLQDGIIDTKDAVPYESADLIANALELGGHSDWRLPTVRELQTLIDLTRFNPAMDPVFTDSTVPEGDGAIPEYISSDPFSPGSDGLWTVGFTGDGHVSTWGGGRKFYLRMVRDQ